MAIEKIKSKGHVYLVERQSYRGEDGKLHKRTIRYLGREDVVDKTAYALSVVARVRAEANIPEDGGYENVTKSSRVTLSGMYGQSCIHII